MIYAVRQPDSDTFRYWESAGTAHAGNSRADFAPKERRDWGTDQEVHIPPGFWGDEPPNTLDTTPIFDAAIHQMHRWVEDGTKPPILPRIEFSGVPPAIERDDLGIAKGGLRLPAVEVPLETFRAARTGGDERAGRLLGSRLPLSEETLRSLYPNRDSYLDPFEQATENGIEAGYLLPRDADRMVREAELVDLRWWDV